MTNSEDRALPASQDRAATPSGPSPKTVSGIAGIPSARVWRVTSYMPSHKHFSLSTDLTPEQIEAATGAKSKGPSKDGKCKFQWEFYASRWFENDHGDMVEITLPCAIWDYKGSRWSAYGPSAAFREIGLLPPASAMSAGTAETNADSAQGQRPASAVDEVETPNPSTGDHP
jgi:hypothetical protein